MAEVTLEEMRRGERILQSEGDNFIDPRQEPRTAEAARGVLALEGRAQWSDERIPLQQRTESFLRTHAVAGTSDWRQITSQAQQHFPGVDFTPAARGYERHLNTEQARQRYENWHPTMWDIAGRQMVPFVSTAFSSAERQWAADAERRMAAGRPQPADYDILARSQRLHGLYERAGFPAEITRSIAGLPAIAGEMAFASGGVGLAQRAAPRVFGAAAEGAAAARAPLPLGAAGQWGARTALTTALAPSMYAPQAAENAAAQGGTWSDLRNLGPAYATGFINTAVIGSVQHLGGRGALGLLNKTLIGVGEQAAADVATGFMNQHWFGLKNADYGLFPEVLNGRWGEAARRAGHQALTFALLGAMHHEWGARNPVAESTQALLREGREDHQPPEQTVRTLIESQLPVVEAMRQNPDLTQAEARGAAQTAPAGTQRQVAEAMAEAVPTKTPEKPSAPPPQSRTMTPDQATAALAAEKAKPPARPTVVGARAAPRPKAPMEATVEARIGEIAKEAQSKGMAGDVASAYAWDKVAREYPAPAPGNAHAYAHAVTERLFGPRPQAPAAPPSPPAAPEAARPPEPAQAPPAAPQAAADPVTRAGQVFQEMFPGMKTSGEALRVEHEGRWIELREGHTKDTVRLDFGWLGERIGRGNQPGDKQVVFEIGKLVSRLRETGVGVEYVAVGGRERAYAVGLKRAGYEQVSGPTGEGGELRVWRPKAAESEPPQLKPPVPPQLVEPPAKIGAREKAAKPLNAKEQEKVAALVERGKLSQEEAARLTPEMARTVLRQRAEKNVNTEPVHPELEARVDQLAFDAGLTPEEVAVVKELLRGNGLRHAGRQIGLTQDPAAGRARSALEKLKAADPETWQDVNKFQDIEKQAAELNRNLQASEMLRGTKFDGAVEAVEKSDTQDSLRAFDQVLSEVSNNEFKSLSDDNLDGLMDRLLEQQRRTTDQKDHLDLTEEINLLAEEQQRRTRRGPEERTGAVANSGVETPVRRATPEGLQEATGNAAAADTGEGGPPAEPGQASQWPAEAADRGQTGEPAGSPAAGERGQTASDKLTERERSEAHAIGQEHGDPVEAVEAALEGAELEARQQAAAEARAQASQGPASAREARLERQRRKQQGLGAAQTPVSPEGTGGVGPGPAGGAGQPGRPVAHEDLVSRAYENSGVDRGTPWESIDQEKRHQLSKELGFSLRDAESPEEQAAVLAEYSRFPHEVRGRAGDVVPADHSYMIVEGDIEKGDPVRLKSPAVYVQGRGPHPYLAAMAVGDKVSTDAFPQAPTRVAGLSGGQPDAGEAPQQPQRTTALANAQVAIERIEKKLPPLAGENPVSDQHLRAEAVAVLQRDPQAGAKLVEELFGNQRPLAPLEVMVLLHHRAALRNEYQQTLEDITAEIGRHVKALGSQELRTAISSRLDTLEIQERTLMARLDQLDRAIGPAKSTMGRSFRLLRALMAEDYSLAGLLQQAEQARGKPLSETERSQITDMAAEIKRLQDLLAGMEDKGEVKPGAPSETGFRLVQAKARFDAHVEAWRRENAPWHVKALRVAGELTSAIPRTIMSSIDFPLLRQGLIGVVTRPTLVPKWVKEMTRIFFSGEAAERMQYDIDHRENSRNGLYQAGGVDFAGGPRQPREEGFLSRLIDKVPGLGHVVRASERGYKVLNLIRADVFDSMVDSLAVGGKVTNAEAKVIGTYTNVATGRGPLGPFEPAAKALSWTFFAPKWAISRFQYLLGYPLYSNFSENAPRARALIAKEYARFVAGMGVAVGLATLAGFDLEKDPRSSNFGKVKVGNTRLDFTGGLAGTARLLSQTLTLSTKNQKGQIVPLSGVRPFGRDNYADVLARYIRGKLAPAPGAALDLLSGTDVVGQPVTPASRAGGLVTPLYARDVYEAMIDLGIERGTVVSLLGLLGMSMTTYDPKAPRQRQPLGAR